MEPFIGNCEGKRWIALIVDNMIAMFIGIGVGWIIPVDSGEVRLAIGLLAYLAYFLISEALWFRTLGKRICGLIVIRRDGTMPGWREATLRTLFRLVEVNPIFGALPAGLVILFSASKQRIGDMAAGTVVVMLADLEFVEDMAT
jgi:uncharacterized RDD family membrane protein YckC